MICRKHTAYISPRVSESIHLSTCLRKHTSLYASPKFVLEFSFHLALCCCFCSCFVVTVLVVVSASVATGASADVVGEV